MQLEPDDSTMIITRLRRGQRPPRLRDPHAREGPSVRTHSPNLAAVGEAISCGGYALVATGLSSVWPMTDAKAVDTKLEKLLVVLASYGVT